MSAVDSFTPRELELMTTALALAETGLGEVWPNPSVACLLVKDGVVVARGRTAAHGRPHAEVLALAQAGESARGATALVTLEPCSHWGRTPPCSDALVAAGVAEVIVAVKDPDPRVNGRGLERLRAAGVRVRVGALEAAATALNAGFFQRVATGRPRIEIVHDDSSRRAFDAMIHSTNGRLAPPDRLDIAVGGLAPMGSAPAPSGSQPAGDVSDWCIRFNQGTESSSESEIATRFPADASGLSHILAQLGERGLTRLAALASDPLTLLLRAASLVGEASTERR